MGFRLAIATCDTCRTVSAPAVNGNVPRARQILGSCKVPQCPGAVRFMGLIDVDAVSSLSPVPKFNSSAEAPTPPAKKP